MAIINMKSMDKFMKLGTEISAIFNREHLTIFEGKLVLALVRDEVHTQGTKSSVNEDLAKRGVLAKVD